MKVDSDANKKKQNGNADSRERRGVSATPKAEAFYVENRTRPQTKTRRSTRTVVQIPTLSTRTEDQVFNGWMDVHVNLPGGGG